MDTIDANPQSTKNINRNTGRFVKYSPVV